MKHLKRKGLAVIMAGLMTASLAACAGNTGADKNTEATQASIATTDESAAANTSSATTSTVKKLSEADITINDTIENSTGGEHAITADGESASYSNTKVVKTDGKHANAVFSYGEGTTVNIKDSYIETSGNCSGGLMTTGGGTMNATDLTINTSGNSSAAIRSDRGGGTVNVDGGSYTTSGTGSPVIYSTADITVSNAEMNSTASQGVVVEGKNSVTLNNVTLNADNNTKNSDKSDWYQAVMIYQSMSGDAAQGTSSFTMNGGTLTNANGDVFFVNNTATDITLSNATIVNNDNNGVFLRAAAAGWGSDGSNGGQVNLNATNQEINGDMIVDDISVLNLYLKENSSFSGSVNSSGEAGKVYVDLSGGSKWTLTADSYITSLTCDTDSINLNGHKLYVNGVEYKEGTASSGTAIEFTVSSGGHEGGGTPPDKPGDHDGGTPPAKPE